MKYFIVTGGSKGMGQCIVEELLDPNHSLLVISRTINEGLVQKASELNVESKFLSFDLQNITDIPALIKDWKVTINEENLDGLYLINNAGIIQPVSPIYHCDSNDIIKNININLIAPMILQSEFLKVCHELVGVNDTLVDKKILNISSGAGQRAIQGWSSYCTSKAGLDMFSQCVVEDLNEVDSSIKVVSIAPGIVDTNMQTEIRSSSEGEFALVEQFKEYKDKGQLLKPEFVGQKVVQFILSDEFGEETMTRIDQL